MTDETLDARLELAGEQFQQGIEDAKDALDSLEAINDRCARDRPFDA